jgi:hypothetical protein
MFSQYRRCSQLKICSALIIQRQDLVLTLSATVGHYTIYLGDLFFNQTTIDNVVLEIIQQDMILHPELFSPSE